MPRLRAFRMVAAIGLVVVALSALVPLAAAVADETTTVPATPACPSGSDYVSSAGECQQPAELLCPAGLSPSGNQCVAPSTCPPGQTGPDRGTCTDPNAGPLMTRVRCPGSSQAIGDSNTCQGSPTYQCPRGQAMRSNYICGYPVRWTCPAGGTLSGQTCTVPKQAAAAASAPKPAAAPMAAPSGRPSRLGLQIAATGSSHTRTGLGVAGWAFALGGLLLVVAAQPRRRRAR